MSGYMDFEMSNNAVDAYNAGLLPASKISKVPSFLVSKYVKPVEVHHTSCKFNETAFYDQEQVLAVFGLINSDDYDANPAAVDDFQKWEKEKKEPAQPFNAKITYIQWHKTNGRFFKEEIVCLAKVVKRGLMVDLLLPGGKKICKKWTSILSCTKL